MSSVSDFGICSICGSEVSIHFNCRTLEEWMTCTGCGRHVSNEVLFSDDKKDENGRALFVLGVDGKRVERLDNALPVGTFSFCFPNGFSQFGALLEGTTLENWPQEFPFDLDGRLLNEKNEPVEMDMTRSHITFYDRETKTFETVWGTKPEGLVVADPVNEDSLVDWDKVDMPVGVFLSENATDEQCKHYNLKRVPTEG